MKHIKLLGWLAALSICIIYSCNDSSFCLSNQHALQAAFKAASSNGDKDTTLSGITIWGRLDSLSYDSARINEMFMPLNLNEDSAIFYIMEERLIDESIIRSYDTLHFRYVRTPYYISGDCGMTFNITLDTVIHTTNLIDSVIITYPNVFYGENIQNVKIFIEP